MGKFLSDEVAEEKKADLLTFLSPIKCHCELKVECLKKKKKSSTNFCIT